MKKAYWPMLSEYTVAGVAAESPHGAALARKWIGSDTEATASCGWCTFSGLVAIKPDEELDLAEVDLGGTACKVPDALAYIQKVEQAGKLGKKRKSAIC